MTVNLLSKLAAVRACCGWQSGWCGVVLACAAAQALAAEPATPAASAASAPVVAPAASNWVKVEGAWIRPMVPGQTATGGYMSLTASQPLTLVGFKSAAARTTELHEMKMDGDVMRMRAIPSLGLPAGQAVVMQPGGQHLMLMGVTAPLQVGADVTLTLKLRKADGKTVTQDVVVPVRPRP